MTTDHSLSLCCLCYFEHDENTYLCHVLPAALADWERSVAGTDIQDVRPGKPIAWLRNGSGLELELHCP